MPANMLAQALVVCWVHCLAADARAWRLNTPASLAGFHGMTAIFKSVCSGAGKMSGFPPP